MGLFGLGSKRSPLPQPIAPRPEPSTDVSTTTSSCSNETVGRVRGLLAAVTSTKGPSASQQADVEVSELNLDEDEFSSTFGAGTSQFVETTFGQRGADADPWTSRRRLD
jgi:hypothetical protein